MENLADAIDNGSRDQHSDALVCVFFIFNFNFRLVLVFILKIIDYFFCWVLGRLMN